MKKEKKKKRMIVRRYENLNAVHAQFVYSHALSSLLLLLLLLLSSQTRGQSIEGAACNTNSNGESSGRCRDKNVCSRYGFARRGDSTVGSVLCEGKCF